MGLKMKTMKTSEKHNKVEQQNSEVTKEIGKYCLDLSKLVFGGALLSTVMQEGLPSFWIIIGGRFSSCNSSHKWFFTH